MTKKLFKVLKYYLKWMFSVMVRASGSVIKKWRIQTPQKIEIFFRTEFIWSI